MKFYTKSGCDYANSMNSKEFSEKCDRTRKAKRVNIAIWHKEVQQKRKNVSKKQSCATSVT